LRRILSKPGYLRDLLVRDRWEFALAAIVVSGELTLGVLEGIALGVGLSLLMLIYRTSHPQGAVLGQLPGTEAYRDVKRLRGSNLPWVADLARRRRPVLCEHQSPR
jgi:MFS superfamily sulfate permease-like transporter